jgi:hypothetical protein
MPLKITQVGPVEQAGLEADLEARRIASVGQPGFQYDPRASTAKKPLPYDMEDPISPELAEKIIAESGIQNRNSYESKNIQRGKDPGMLPVALHPVSIDDAAIRDPKRSATDIQEEVTMLRVLTLRSRGKSVYHISADLGLDRATINKMLDLALKAVAAGSTERAEQVRELENYRLDQMLDRLWTLAVPDSPNVDPDMQAVDRVLKIMDRRAKMYGIDQIPEAEAADGISQSIHFTQIIAGNPGSIDLSHRLLEHIANLTDPQIQPGWTSTPAHTREVQDSQAHTTSIFDIDTGDGGDLSAGAGGDAAETRQDGTDQ